jgi:acetylornithine deacetylase
MTELTVGQRVANVLSERLGDLPGFVSDLVREQSLLGCEEGAQTLVARRLEAAGFEVRRVVPDAAAALADPSAGYPSLPYEGRSSIVGVRRGTGRGRSLHLTGHIDVVPVDPAAPWTRDPWSGEEVDGRIWGRGAGDMKGGLAAYLLAAEAVAQACPELPGDLVVSSVIEEECGGNGMWSVIRDGVSTDATLVGEPTGLAIVHAGTGVLWLRLFARGAAGHSAYSGGDGPFDALARAIAALRRLESEQNAPPVDQVFGAVSGWPYGMTVGRIGGGIWTSSAPAELEVAVRYGLRLGAEPAEMQARITAAVAAADPGVEVVFEAFRAPAYCWPVEGPMPELLARTHEEVVGSPAQRTAFTATTDARQVQGALCYGPLAGSLHGADEWVDVDSLKTTARVVARFVAGWLGG